ncbi:MAG: aminopeptidase P family protein, partial [Chloroflexi bacterium]|nr:aminopeptidase P family protein [Chloroflexota bacterium]
GRLVSAEAAATHWLMTLSPKELEVYPHIVAITHQIIASCYSPASITPGVTTTRDLEYLFWQRTLDLGLELSFTPFFDLVRSEADQSQHLTDDLVIRPGDLIHCDVGNRYLRLCSDLQEWAYILRPGETEAPAGVKRLMAEGNRLQKVYQGAFRRGLSGDEMLKDMLDQAHREGIPNPRVYSHSLGLYLHEPGPLIGLPWEQVSNPGRGEVKLDENTCFTMELSVEAPVPEWGGQSVRMSLEQDVMFTSTGCQPMDKVQTEFYLV